MEKLNVKKQIEKPNREKLDVCFGTVASNRNFTTFPPKETNGKGVNLITSSSSSSSYTNEGFLAGLHWQASNASPHCFHCVCPCGLVCFGLQHSLERPHCRISPPTEK